MSILIIEEDHHDGEEDHVNDIVDNNSDSNL